MSTATWWQTNVNWAPKLAVFESFSIRAHVSPVFLCILYSSSILRHCLVTVDNNFIFFFIYHPRCSFKVSEYCRMMKKATNL